MRGSRQIEHLGPAHDNAGLEGLKAAARRSSERTSRDGPERRYDPGMSEEFQDILAEMREERFSLIPSEIYEKDHFQGTDVPFLDLLLVQLGYGPSYGLSAEQAVRDFVHGQPGMYEQIREAGTAVYRAGARARNHGLLRSSFDDSLRPYSADEIWCMDLAIDVLAMLAAVPGLSGGARFSALDALRDLYMTCSGHAWHKQVKHAVAGPHEFRELRARIPVRPKHLPKPGRLLPEEWLGEDI
jgi:hypothetical protein